MKYLNSEVRKLWAVSRGMKRQEEPIYERTQIILL